MILNLYRVNDGDNTINKVKTDLKSINVNLRKDFDLQNPIFIINDTDSIGVTAFNYCELPELNRFYFINYIEGVNANLFKLNCSTDLLETFKNDVLNSHAKFYRKIKVGDYQNGSIDLGVKSSITKIESNVTLPPVNTMLLTTIEDRT